MVDPNKLKDFLQRTSDALKRSLDAGDAEGVNKYEAMLDRATPLAEKVAAQPQVMPPAGPTGPQGAAGPETQEPVIPWGAAQAKPAMPAAPAPAVQEGPQVPNPFALPQGGSKAPLLTMPGGQATPQTSKGTPPASPGLASEIWNFDLPGGIQKGFSAAKEAVASPVTKDLAKRGIFGAAGTVAAGVDEALNGAPKSAKALDLPSAPKSKFEGEPVGDGNDDPPGTIDYQDNERAKPILDDALANPADDVEAEALKRIATIEKLKDKMPKRQWAEYLFTLLLLGAPRTFAMLMSDRDKYDKDATDMYDKTAAMINQKGRDKVIQELRAREAGTSEMNAKANTLRALNSGMPRGEDPADKYARTVLNNPTVDRKSEIYTESEKRALMKLKPPAQDTTIPR